MEQITLLNQPKDTLETASNIDVWYNSGRPYFSRDSIKEIQQQLKRSLKHGDKIYIKGLDGIQVAFEILTRENQSPGSDRHDAFATPKIRYMSIQSLKEYLQPNRLHLAYCNLRIAHSYPASDLVHGKGSHSPPKSRAEVAHLFENARQVWEDSAMWAAIQSTLTPAKILPNIQKVIGVACGTMSSRDEIAIMNHSSAFQHSLLLAIQRFLLNGHNNTTGQITCHAQDPAYTEADRSVLEEADIHILDDPQAFLEIDDSSIVFSCAPNVPVKQIIADLARPAVIIWDKVRDGEEGERIGGCISTDPDSPRVRKMIQDCYDTFGFPSDEHFSDLAIYVRRAGS